MLKKVKFVLVILVLICGYCFNSVAEDVVEVTEMESVPEEQVPEIAEEFVSEDQMPEEDVATFDEEQIVDNQQEPMQIEDVVEPIESDEQMAEQISVDALNDYQIEGSLFEKITLLEQDKIVLQLEKERAQLDLELERLNAEKLKLQMELDTLSGRAEHQQQELEVAKAQLEAQAEQLKRQKENLDNPETPVMRAPVAPRQQVPEELSSLSGKYKLVNIVGMGNQLQATLQEISSGQNKRVSVGKDLDGFIIKSISLNDGIVFEKDGVSETLNIGK